MSNVIRLFAEQPVETLHPGMDMPMATTLAKLAAATGQLRDVIDALALQFDAIEPTLARIDDMATRRRCADTIDNCRNALSSASIELARQIERLVSVILNHGRDTNDDMDDAKSDWSLQPCAAQSEAHLSRR